MIKHHHNRTERIVMFGNIEISIPNELKTYQVASNIYRNPHVGAGVLYIFFLDFYYTNCVAVCITG